MELLAVSGNSAACHRMIRRLAAREPMSDDEFDPVDDLDILEAENPSETPSPPTTILTTQPPTPPSVTDGSAYVNIPALYIIFSSNSLKTLRGPFSQLHFPRLLSLNLSFNQLTEIPNQLSIATPLLQVLDLSHNKLSLLDPILFTSWKHLRILRLQHNFLENLSFISPPPSPPMSSSSLNINESLSTNPSGKTNWSMLEELWLDDNRISEWRQLLQFQVFGGSVSRLRVLSIRRGNPFASSKHRLDEFVATMFPQLELLDGVPRSADGSGWAAGLAPGAADGVDLRVLLTQARSYMRSLDTTPQVKDDQTEDRATRRLRPRINSITQPPKPSREASTTPTEPPLRKAHPPKQELASRLVSSESIPFSSQKSTNETRKSRKLLASELPRPAAPSAPDPNANLSQLNSNLDQMLADLRQLAVE